MFAFCNWPSSSAVLGSAEGVSSEGVALGGVVSTNAGDVASWDDASLGWLLNHHQPPIASITAMTSNITSHTHSRRGRLGVDNAAGRVNVDVVDSSSGSSGTTTPAA